MNSRKGTCLLAAFLMVSATFAFAQGTYAQFDVPGAVFTTPFGINSEGDVVGASSDELGDEHGFLLHAGVFTTLDCPGAEDTLAYGINDAGQIVGDCSTGGFLYDISTQTFTTLQYSPGTHTVAWAINNAGTIVGEIYDLGGGRDRSPLGFEFDGTTYTLLQTPGVNPIGASLIAINNVGRALMQVYGHNGQTLRYYLIIDGNPKPLERSARLFPWGLNDLNAIVGSYGVSNNESGFVLLDDSRQSVRFPRSNFTVARGINNAGVVVGFFGDGGGQHGFIWTPPADAATE